MKKSILLKRLLTSKNTEFILEAHNGLSASIVEEAGIKGIWASSLCISAAMGVRDNNEASWTQTLEVVESMSDKTKIPILLDADTGYGNFNNVRQLVKKMEKRDIAGLCMEDKLFPKTNSFIQGEKQLLADIDEYCGKLNAAMDCRKDSDFVVVARTEAFIVGHGVDETLRRAKAYSETGADAVFVHSKADTIEQIRSFMKEWDDSCPIVIAPTTYFDVGLEVFEELGISVVIWSNQMLRASITSMQQIAAEIFEKRSVTNAEKKIVSVKEVFRLQNVSELLEAERKYLPTKKMFQGNYAGSK